MHEQHLRDRAREGEGRERGGNRQTQTGMMKPGGDIQRVGGCVSRKEKEESKGVCISSLRGRGKGVWQTRTERWVVIWKGVEWKDEKNKI